MQCFYKTSDTHIQVWGRGTVATVVNKKASVVSWEQVPKSIVSSKIKQIYWMVVKDNTNSKIERHRFRANF